MQPVIKEQKDFRITGDEKQEETFWGKGFSQTQNQLSGNTMDIPLLVNCLLLTVL